MLTFKDDKCTESVAMDEAQTKKATLFKWGECKKLDTKVDNKDYWIVYTGARDLTAAVAAAMLAVGAALY